MDAMQHSGCPGEATVDRFVHGRDDEDARQRLEQHLDRCADCCSLVAALAPDRSARARVDLEPGERLGRYTVLRCIGRGAMGEVFAAHDRELDRTVAIKLWNHDSPSRLLAEARALARVNDPHVVAVHDVGCCDGRTFAVMELVDGTTLGEWLAAKTRAVHTITDALVQVGRGLAALHARRLVHRDVKPDNVLVGADGRVRVADLGLASGREPTVRCGADVDAAELRASTIDTLAGTPAYMAPEVLRGAEADARADQYSYAVVIWEALFGRRPFAAHDLFVQLQRAEQGACEPPRGHAVPRRIVRALRRALAPDPCARFTSVTELVAAIVRRPRRRRVAFLLVATTACASLGHLAAMRLDRILTQSTAPSCAADWRTP
jgi:eukaryotic-like serine/threonine-protein kinase